MSNKTNVGKSVVGHDTGIDVRGDNGQIVVAPTIRNGIPYKWLSDPIETPLAELPAPWLDLILGQERSPQTTSADRADTISAGNGNDTMFRKACGLRGKGIGARPGSSRS